MKIEVRPVQSAEVEGFLRATPAGRGLPTWEPEPAAWWSGPGIGPVFGGIGDARWLQRMHQDMHEPERTAAAFVDGRLVGTSAMLSLEVTVPGRGPVPMGGVTWVGVLPTCRRRGALTAMLDDCRARGEAVAGLSASEGGIYDRFDFGPATPQVRWEPERREATWLRPAPAACGLELVERARAVAVWPSLHDQVRRLRVGEVAAAPGFWEGLAGDDDEAGTDPGRRSASSTTMVGERWTGPCCTAFPGTRTRARAAACRWTGSKPPPRPSRGMASSPRRRLPWIVRRKP